MSFLTWLWRLVAGEGHEACPPTAPTPRGPVYEPEKEPSNPVPPSLRPSVPPKPVPPIGSRAYTVAQHPSPNCTKGRTEGSTEGKVEYVVLHATEGSYAGALDWLTRGDRIKPSSAHYLIGKDGAVAKLVAESDMAWHAGKSAWGGRTNLNHWSVGIELENKNNGKDPYPPAQLEVLMALVVGLCRTYGLPPAAVVGHADIAPGRKTDPVGFPWAPFREALAYHLQEAP